MTPDPQLKTVYIARGSKNMKQHAIVWEYIRIEVDGHQPMIWYPAGVYRELRDQCIATRNGKPRWETKIFVWIVSEINHHDVVSSGIFADECSDKQPQERTKQAIPTLEDAPDLYLLNVIAESHMLMQQLMCRQVLTCLQLSQGKDLRYS